MLGKLRWTAKVARLYTGRPHNKVPIVLGGRGSFDSHDFICKGPSFGGREKSGNSLTAAGRWEARAEAVT